MRGSLSETKHRDIQKILPTIDNRRLMVATSQSPGVDLNDLVNRNELGVALVCLADAGDRFRDANQSLHEAHANLAWYLEESPNAPQEVQSIWTCKFYADYVALLLYAGAEDAADFIVHFLGVEQDLKDFLASPGTQRELTRKKISSYSAKVGIYMRDKYPSHKITKIILVRQRRF